MQAASNIYHNDYSCMLLEFFVYDFLTKNKL